MFKYDNIEILHVEITNQCNAACPACARNIPELNFNSNNNRAEITLQQFQNLFEVDFIKQLKKVLFCGVFGDPITAKDLLNIIQYVKTVNPKIVVGVNTNGGARNLTWWKKFAGLLTDQRDYVVWSIDGLEDTNHRYRVNTNFKKIINNATAFIQAGGNAHWDMLVFDYNEHQVEQCEKLAKELGFKWFRKKISSRHEFEIYNKRFDHRPSNVKISSTNYSKINCVALNEKSVYLTAQGTFLPCCIMADRLYLNNIINSHPDLLKKETLTSNLSKTIPIFNEVVDTWSTDTPAEVCKKVCGYSDKNHKIYKMWVKEVEF